MAATKKVLGPLTEEISQGKPPALIKEWEQTLKQRGDLIVLDAGVVKKDESENIFGWYSCWQANSDDGKSIFFLDSIASDLWESVLTAISNRQRFEILRILLREDTCSSQQLAEGTGLQGGALYHHLRELTYVGLIEQKQKKYSLSSFGLQVVLVIGGLLKNTSFDKQGKLQTGARIE